MKKYIALVKGAFLQIPAKLNELFYLVRFFRTFNKFTPKPNTTFSSSFRLNSKWGDRVAGKLSELETDFASDLLQTIRDEQVPGDIVEFGVYHGTWMEKLIQITGKIGLKKEIIGFDSFEGLSRVSKSYDLDCWHQGQYAANYEDVARRLDVATNRHVSLVKGWFSETLPGQVAQSISKVSFARIDCDLYEPTVECLEFLTTRLSNGSILVFDDWTFNLNKGETKAFFEWSRRHPELSFEFLCFIGNGQVYLRVHQSERSEPDYEQHGASPRQSLVDSHVL